MTKNTMILGLLLTSIARIYAGTAIDSDLNRLRDDLSALDNQVLEYQLINKVFKNPAKGLKLANIVVSSDDDPRFKNSVKPIRYSIWGRPVRYPARPEGKMFKGQYIYLYLPKKLTSGKSYSVSLKNTFVYKLDKNNQFTRKGKIPAPTLKFKFLGDQGRCDALAVNQVGYLPNAPKYGYLTAYSGLKNGTKEKTFINFSRYKTFKVIDDQTKRTVLEGKIVISPNCISKTGKQVKSKLSESIVWGLDFSSLTISGRYRLLVPGGGVSYPFTISDKIYNQVFGVLCQGMYHQRCGMALTKEWTRHTHPACHTDDGLIPDVALYPNQTFDYIPQKSMVHQNCVHGHHDAGDFGKYSYNGALFVANILLPFDVFPKKLLFDNSPIPESGNGKADLLEEVKWELDWLSNMQDPDDGGVHIIVKPAKVGYENNVSGEPNEKTKAQRRLWWKEPHVTAAFAAALAKAARCKPFRKLYPEECVEYLKKAELAWQFCMKYVDKNGDPKPMIGDHHYGAKHGGRDEYFWMAVELWLTTGKKEYNAYLKKRNIDEVLQESWLWNWRPMHEAYGQAIRAYVYSKANKGDKDKVIYDKMRKNILRAVETTMGWQKNWAFKCAFASQAYKYKKWGWYFLADISSYDLLLATTLVDKSKAKEFLDAACLNADQELGDNPDNHVTITGIGSKRIVDLVHQNSRYDRIIEPVPGLPTGFFPARPAPVWYKIPMWDFTYGGLPITYRAVDAWSILQEFTVPQLATTVMTYAMLSVEEKQISGFPALTVTANGEESIEGEAPFKVTFKADAKAVDGKKIRDYCWDLGNEDFAADKEFEYTFNIPGAYKICCTVTDDDGWSTYKYLHVRVRQKTDTLPNGGIPLKRTADTIALFNFDQGFKDDVTGAELKVKNAELSSQNLMWMKTPLGKAVKCVGGGYAVQYDFDKNMFKDPTVQSLTVDCMLYFRDEWPEKDKNCYQFLLNNAWTHIFGRIRSQWKSASVCVPVKDELILTKTKRRILEIFKPTPGWHMLSMGFNKKSGMGTLEFDGKKVEFKMTQTDFLKKKTNLQIGAFQGFFDELRIRATIVPKDTE